MSRDSAGTQYPSDEVSAEPSVTVQDVSIMQEYMLKMKEFLVKTECVRSQFCEEIGLELYLKKDFRQVTGSCHARSALCTLLSLSTEQKKCGVITALEEDALPLCYFAEKLNVQVVIVLPNTTLLNEINALEQYRYGTTRLFIEGNNSDEAEDFASKFATTNNMYFIKRDDRARFIGYGTIGIEIAEQVPNLGVVVVPQYTPIFTSILSVMAVLKPSVKVIISAENSSTSRSSSKTFQSIQLSSSSILSLDSASSQVAWSPIPSIASYQIFPSTKLISSETSSKSTPELSISKCSRLSKKLNLPQKGSLTNIEHILNNTNSMVYNINIKEDNIDTIMLELFEKERCIVDRFDAMSMMTCFLLAQEPSLGAYKNKSMVSLLTSTIDDIVGLPRILEQALLNVDHLVNIPPNEWDNNPNVITEVFDALKSDFSIKKITFKQELIAFKNMKIHAVCERLE